MGKSSLLNALLEEEKAIVTDIAGTTRDIVEGEIHLGDFTLSIMDTAGIRQTEDVVEKIGVQKSLQYMKEANLVLAVLDGSMPLTQEDKDLLEQLNPNKTIVILNKKDKGLVISKEDLKDFQTVPMSTLEIEGVEPLKAQIQNMFAQEKLEENDTEILLNARQVALAEKANQLLKTVEHSLQEGVELDMLSLDLKEILDTLGMITGESYSEEILDTLFENFCVGK